MKYYIIAGEASGDLHGANLIKGIRANDPEAQVRAWGGDKMQENGADLVKHYKETAVMGYASVIKSLGKIRKNLKLCKQDIADYNPDVVIFIDYPGFNLRIAKYAKKNGYRTFYYIAPKIWAWKTYRIKAIKKYVDRLYSILPFEVDFYKSYNYPIEYVGNPLLDAIDAQLNRGELLDDFLKRHDLPHKPIIGLLPGSRRQEIKGLLPMMLRLKSHFPEYQFLISAAPGISEDYYAQFMDDDKNNNLIHNDTYQMVKHADACIVASGTAALETALIGTPQVAVYKVGGGILAHAVGRLVIKVKWATLVNLIMQKEIIKELLQKDFTFAKLKKELKAILPNGEKRANLLNQYQELYTKMGNTGASARAAESMVKRLKEDLK
ncbi:Lipid-A-disaccharide synthase [Salinivirga cyanobacteriivorans]|uniref:Lipid-A-disaccharide synthase n=1 Tax=Salinivirga cyanobacteriivorans TaxID=1307839 RepID=A0A0S2I3I5_9BACT|nr:lipid-A-disaccharide synthase [Salinivirga cyanobacteriivorans]ALO16879.1 Lipid-A-disaccharide synthase [Salinivirga cyanobacteriivorans]